MGLIVLSHLHACRSRGLTRALAGFAEEQHARSSCTFDATTLLIDLKAWVRADMQGRLLDLLGTQRKRETDGLYLRPAASTISGTSTARSPR